jgi:hypothetical protein
MKKFNTRPGTLYSSGERFGRNWQQDEIDIFKKDLLYINSEGQYGVPEGPNPDDSLVRSRYERLDPQVTLKRSHIRELVDDRNAYYNFYNSRKCDPEDWVQETCNAQRLDPDLMFKWGLAGSRPENRQNRKIVDQNGKIDLPFNIYNRRPNHERIQTDGTRWLYDLEGYPNEFDVKKESYQIRDTRKTLGNRSDFYPGYRKW